uniref:DNA repair and recombination protein PIF1 n=1 Tax=Cajanus cajan TaxID=3821 RepID=A0A151SGN9_CAJCA|nr:DNA repair and recombination protein PIF1 [Cajanus cajan]KYP53953.1 DNA repair and recombination protein PIF1 [Cajanus cajan]
MDVLNNKQSEVFFLKNEDDQKLNDIIVSYFPREECVMLSFDEYVMDMNMLDVEILIGHNTAGKRAFLAKIKHKTTESARLPFVLIRKQFPMKLSFVITINKSQGQTIPNVEIYLPRHVFSHGQLYVTLSRGVSQASTKILIKKGKLEGKMETLQKILFSKKFCYLKIKCYPF